MSLFADYTEDSASLRARLDVIEERKTSYTYRESKADTSAVRPVA
jgi:hypothetical protein